MDKKHRHQEYESRTLLVTACTRAMGKSDNCEEIQVLKSYRDGFLKLFSRGKDDLEHYYEISPKICEEINKREDSEKIYKKLYRTVVKKSVTYIENGKMLDTYDLFIHTMDELEKTYL